VDDELGTTLAVDELVLRPWRRTDAASVLAACQDPEIARWTPIPVPYREADARAYLLARYDAIHAGTSAPFAIVSRGTETLLGSIALNHPQREHRRAEVGYWLAPGARGAGHATRALSLICAWGFRALELERIELLAATGNIPSQRVADRAGFSREAVLRSYMRGRAERGDMVMYSLLRDDWEPALDVVKR